MKIKMTNFDIRFLMIFEKYGKEREERIHEALGYLSAMEDFGKITSGQRRFLMKCVIHTKHIEVLELYEKYRKCF